MCWTDDAQLPMHGRDPGLHRRELGRLEHPPSEECREERGHVVGGRDDLAGPPRRGADQGRDVDELPGDDRQPAQAPEVAMGDPSGDRTPRRERGCVEAERTKDPFPQLVAERRPRGGLDYETEQDVVRVRVVPVRSGTEEQLVPGGDPHEFTRRPRAPGMGDPLRRPLSVGRVVVETARVVEQLAERDRPALGHKARYPPVHGIREAKPSLGGELERDRGDKRLGDTRDPEAVARRHREAGSDPGQSSGCATDAGGRSHDDDRAGRAVLDELLDDLVQLQHRRGSSCAGRRFRCGG